LNKKIVIFTQSPISKTPRVVKEANCLAKNGYDVTVFGLWYESSIINKDFDLLDTRINYKPGIDLSKDNFTSTIHRLRCRFYREAVRFFRLQSKHALGYGYFEYLEKLKAQKANLYIGHQEMSLALAKDLIKLGYKVAFDFEDYHSHDLLPKDRLYRPIKLLMSLEDYVLKNAIYCVTTSDVLAVELATKYQVSAPTTIYNSFQSVDLQEKKLLTDINSLVWISQVIGPGRGLELLIKAISKSKLKYELTLIGKKDFEFCAWILKNSPQNLKIIFADYIHPNQIATELVKFDVGLAFEEIEPKSRDLTITNKLFHYLNSGIAILATNTKGQREIGHKANGSIVLTELEVDDISSNLEEIFSDREKLDMMKSKSRFYGNEIFCFEKEEEKILNLVFKLL